MYWPSPFFAEPNENNEDHGELSLPRIPAMAAVEDVMWEQLAYLMDHGTCNPSNCPECYRFGQVRAILLKMFTEKR